MSKKECVTEVCTNPQSGGSPHCIECSEAIVAYEASQEEKPAADLLCKTEGCGNYWAPGFMYCNQCMEKMDAHPIQFDSVIKSPTPHELAERLALSWIGAGCPSPGYKLGGLLEAYFEGIRDKLYEQEGGSDD